MYKLLSNSLPDGFLLHFLKGLNQWGEGDFGFHLIITSPVLDNSVVNICAFSQLLSFKQNILARRA